LYFNKVTLAGCETMMMMRTVCLKAREENEMKKKRIAELQMQANALLASRSQMKTKESELKSALVNKHMLLT